MMTIPKWMCVRALIGCLSSPADEARSSACFRILRASSYFFAWKAVTASRFICGDLVDRFVRIGGGLGERARGKREQGGERGDAKQRVDGVPHAVLASYSCGREGRGERAPALGREEEPFYHGFPEIYSGLLQCPERPVGLRGV